MYPKQCISLIFFCLLMIDSICSDDFTVTPITTSSGLYYEKIGEVLLSNNNWKFITSVDYKGYMLYYQYLFQQADQIGQFCQSVTLKECESRYNLIRSRLQRIEEMDESLANFLGVTTKRRRVKRFWSELGGFLGGFVVGLFGGGEDSSEYDEEINDLRKGQADLKNQLNYQQTLFLIDSERKSMQINWLQKTQGELQNKIGTLQDTFEADSKQKEEKIKELKKMLSETDQKLKMQAEIQKKLGKQVGEIEKKVLQINQDIKEINETVTNNKNKIKENELKIKLNSISIDLDFVMTQFENEQKTLYEVIKNANRGNLDPYILTPLNLVEMLQGINPNLPEDTKFPFYPSIENAHKLYNVIKTSVKLSNSAIMFYLNIPLVHSKSFNLHKITSLPAAVDQNKFAFILPQDPFLIIDRKYQQYMLMSSNDYKDFCTEIESGSYLCSQVQQTSFAHSSKDCELVLFRSTKSIPDSCNKRIMHLSSPLFLQLQQPNSWIYVIPEMETLIVNCGKNHTSNSLQGSGFIHINHDCNINIGDLFLTTIVKFSKPVLANYSPPINLTSILDDYQSDNIETPNSARKQVITPFDFDELTEISSALTQKTNMNGLYYALAVILLMVVAILSVLVWKKKIDLHPLLNILLNKQIEAPTEAHIEASENDKLKVKVKLNPNAGDIKRISMSESPSSTDPDAEYLTVRFKVKKDVNADQSTSKPSAPVANVYSPTPTPSSQQYLSVLRKLKPMK